MKKLIYVKAFFYTILVFVLLTLLIFALVYISKNPMLFLIIALSFSFFSLFYLIFRFLKVNQNSNDDENDDK